MKDEFDKTINFNQKLEKEFNNLKSEKVKMIKEHNNHLLLCQQEKLNNNNLLNQQIETLKNKLNDKVKLNKELNSKLNLYKRKLKDFEYEIISSEDEDEISTNFNTNTTINDLLNKKNEKSPEEFSKNKSASLFEHIPSSDLNSSLADFSPETIEKLISNEFFKFFSNYEECQEFLLQNKPSTSKYNPNSL